MKKKLREKIKQYLWQKYANHIPSPFDEEIAKQSADYIMRLIQEDK